MYNFPPQRSCVATLLDNTLPADKVDLRCFPLVEWLKDHVG